MIAELVRLLNLTTSPPLNFTDAGPNYALTADIELPFLARITARLDTLTGEIVVLGSDGTVTTAAEGAPASPGLTAAELEPFPCLYAWREQYEVAEGLYEDKIGGLTGSIEGLLGAAASNNVAYELNRRRDVEPGTVVWMSRAYLGTQWQEYSFDAGVGGDGGPAGLHNLLSVTHPDTVPRTPPDRGALVVGNYPTSVGVPSKWQHFAASVTFRTAVLAQKGNDLVNLNTRWRGCPMSSFDDAELPNLTYNADFPQEWGWFPTTASRVCLHITEGLSTPIDTSAANSVILHVSTKGSLSRSWPFVVSVRTLGGGGRALAVTELGETLLGVPVQTTGIRGNQTMEVFRRISAAKVGGISPDGIGRPFTMLTSYTGPLDDGTEFQVWLGLGHVRTFYPAGNVALAYQVPHVIGNITYEATSNLRLTGHIPPPPGSPVCQAFNIDAVVNAVGPFAYGINARPIFDGGDQLLASIHGSGPLTGEADEAAAIVARGFSGGSGDQNWAFYAITNGVESRFNGPVLTWECAYRTRKDGRFYTGQTGTGIPVVVHGIVVDFVPGGPGGGGPHTLLNRAIHTDTVTYSPPNQGDMIYAQTELTNGEPVAYWAPLSITQPDDLLAVVPDTFGLKPAWKSSRHRLLNGYVGAGPPAAGDRYLEHSDTRDADPLFGDLIMALDPAVEPTSGPPGGIVAVNSKWSRYGTEGASVGDVLTLVEVTPALRRGRWRPPSAATAAFDGAKLYGNDSITIVPNDVNTTLGGWPVAVPAGTLYFDPLQPDFLIAPRAGFYEVGVRVEVIPNVPGWAIMGRYTLTLDSGGIVIAGTSTHVPPTISGPPDAVAFPPGLMSCSEMVELGLGAIVHARFFWQPSELGFAGGSVRVVQKSFWIRFVGSIA